MALLNSFVSFLNEEERNRLAAMPLLGKAKLTRDILIEDPENKLSKTEIMNMLGLSSTHYDKLSNMVLKKAYRFLGGEDDLDQLNFLSKKFMFRHLFHEIRQQRSKVCGSDFSPEDCEKYSRAFFDFSINVPAKYFDEKFVKENADLYLGYVRSDNTSRELEVRSKMLFARLNVLTQAAHSQESITKIEREIIATEKKYSRVRAPAVQAILYHTWINFYRIIRPDWQKRIYYLKRISELYGKSKPMPMFERAIADLHNAEIHFERSKYEEAYELYSQAFAHYLPMLRNQFHHFARWVELALILEKYEDAARLLDSLFKIYVVNRHESNGVLGSLLYAQLYLLTGDYGRAFDYITLCKSLNSLQVYFNYEIRLRILETLYFAYTNEAEFVDRLTQRNMRYIQLQKLSLKKYKYAHYFFLLRDYTAISHRYPHHLASKVKSYMAEFEGGYDAILWKLLDKLYQMPHTGRYKAVK